MTNIITRYVESAHKARDIAFEMIERQRFPANIVSIHDKADGLGDLLAARQVEAKTAKAYEARLKSDGGVIMMVRGTSRPLAVAKKTRVLFEEMGVAETVGLVEEVVIKERGPRPRLSQFRERPHIMTSDRKSVV